LDDEGVAKEVAATKKIITDAGGEVTAEKDWGRRRLAYPIRDFSEGVYHILRFSLKSQDLPTIERYLRLNDNVLRSLVIRDEGTPLEYVPQPSESDDYRDRDRGDRGDRDRDRDRDGSERSGPRRGGYGSRESSHRSGAGARGGEE
jgi:small subunit ribosomal protein S6